MTDIVKQPNATQVAHSYVKQNLLKSNLMVHQHVPLKWSECDICSITKNNYFIEYEIKLSVADFLKDFEKTLCNKTRNIKHNILNGTEHNDWLRPPNRFYYILPEALTVEIPAYCGEIRFSVYNLNSPYGIKYKTIRQAPLLHKNKVDCEMALQLGKCIALKYYFKSKLPLFEKGE